MEMKKMKSWIILWRKRFPTEDTTGNLKLYPSFFVSATAGQIQRKLNIRSSRLEKALKHLLIDG